MARLRRVPRAEMTDPVVQLFHDRLILPGGGTATGSPGDWWEVFALHPAIFRHCVKGFELYRGTALDPVLRELAQVRAGWARQSQFVYSQHCKQLRALGVAEEKVRAVAHWPVSDVFDAAERAVLAYADALVLDGGRVPDEVFAALGRHLPDEQILELTYVTCLYEMHATMARALRLEFDDRPDPIVEVPAPDGYGTRDIADELTEDSPGR
ncbi:carboxymuconolactone decarboxylase family protein [Nonomuraea sp. FMUSA5-5]|uniref:Carboxymuconolactone decarboxylase family protein n=1 Tax=Nonomuraea composti TaxID=2720023 RepID=A0ABX1B774_9ACTN|nr:carboxymuconolactone decarboxylase family protein [Nonomuraea sp. FMUSA5-5]NJP92277.1 carboxymuconolactone decarboxylase family protein [Nonomuraea sp. FMUSA5-5]